MVKLVFIIPQVPPQRGNWTFPPSVQIKMEVLITVKE